MDKTLSVLTNNIPLRKEFHFDVIDDLVEDFKTNYYENSCKIISSFDEKKHPTAEVGNRPAKTIIIDCSSQLGLSR